ncbi:MAG TPA: HD domain-containing protein [Spirochaetota bacterium]|nr:HD domain-containing protein [Spirochaetota bacterium]
MNNYRADYNIVTLDNRILVPAGTVLSDETMAPLVSGCGVDRRAGFLLDYRTVRSDIGEYMLHDSYSIVFSDPAVRERLLGKMSRASLPFPVLEALYYFREYDFYTYRHILMVFALTLLLAEGLIHDEASMIDEMLSAPTHDIGKINVPNTILNKSTPLTQAERKILQHHSVAGYVLLCHFFQDPGNTAAKVARDHHERRDGSGYPLGIRIDNQIVELVMVSDVYDALISPRPYRPMSYNKRSALEEITSMAERGLVNWDIVKYLIILNRKERCPLNEFRVPKEKRGSPPEHNMYNVIADDETSNGPAHN